MSITIPLGLKTALESGECVLFLGAGIGAHLRSADNKVAPDAPQLAVELATYFNVDTKSTNLAKVSQVIEIRKSKSEIEDYLRKRLANLEPDSRLQWLSTLRWRAIFTTNYDAGIERAYELNPKPPQTPVTIASTNELTSYDPRFQVPIYHIHGALFGGRDGIVITENDYTKFSERRRMLFELLKYNFATSTLLYIGYSNQDPNWDLVLNEIAKEFAPSRLPQSYRIAPSTDSLDVEILHAKGVETVSSTFEEFSLLAATQLTDVQMEPDQLRKLQSTVPSDLFSAFEKNPAATLRLLASWTYVNQSPFNETANTDSFLKGDRPNWSLIAHGYYFSRDIEEDTFDELLDYATSSPKRPGSLLVLGSAGYGTTTFLMSLAVKLIKERVGPVFFHRPGAQFLEGDIDFAVSIFPNAPFFVVDNAGDSAAELNAAVTLLRNMGRPAFFMLGERRNEWRQSRGKLSGQQYDLEPLSDAEINRLLDFLTTHKALNKLAPLTHELQVSAIKQRHGKELLVVMREATEDKRFDAIIEDEFRGINDDISRQLYLAVCCLYQHGAYARDRVLADILKVTVEEMYARTGTATEGVVIFDCIDETKGVYAARARHRVIAAIVWERCGDPTTKEEVIQASLSALNLNYKADAQAFEHLVRSDHLIEGIRTFEGKVRFFETACKKDPNSPYVRQHYARMLARERKSELALSQIDLAIALNPKAPPRVLFHTKGLILSQLATSIESADVARKRLVQAEESFRHAMALNRKDEYTYQGLATLYLDWAKRATSEQESAEYISKSEETISEGLRNVKLRDGLWIVSSEIEKWLGNQPSRLKALERAVQEAPGSVVARYLLARAYRNAGSPDKAKKVLGPVIEHHQNEFRAFVEYALALIDLGESRKQANAILNLSTLYGLGDPRFIATYGGLLFLEQQFTEADKVFRESIKREFPSLEQITVHYRPTSGTPRKPLRMEGKVIIVKNSYSLIEVEGYPPIVCPSSKYGNTTLRKGMKVSFEIAFSAKGPVAYYPMIVTQ